MSYEVLARKCRPNTFEEVVGQAHVTRSLMNALSMGRVAHAFLFSGTRGVGKTTTARILAKALNCASGESASPCGRCDVCIEIASGTSVDVIEIDGASNTGVENVRELRENVKYAPAKSPHKVYIIDEVHMLSTGAFNALLKTLEEPPEHVVFIFATTDPHKVPATILSRCQHYEFRRVPKSALEANLRAICDREGIGADDAALSRLAVLAEGSVRDSLSLLDQMLAFSGKEGVREQDIDDVLGLVGLEVVSGAARTVLAQDAAGAIDVVAGLMDRGHELKRFAASLLEYFRDLLVVKVTGPAGKDPDLPDAHLAVLKELAAQTSPEELIRVMNVLAKLGDEFRWSPNHRISLELALVKAASRPIGSVDEILAGLKTAKDLPQARPAPRAAHAGHVVVAASQVVKDPGPREAAAAPKKVREAREASADSGQGDEAHYAYPESPAGDADEMHDDETWNAVLAHVRKNTAADDPIINKLAHSVPLGPKGKTFEIAMRNDFLSLSKAEKALVEEALAAVTGSRVRLAEAESLKARGKKSVAEKKEEEKNSKMGKIKSDAMEHPIVKSALDLFGGEVVGINDESLS